MRLRNFFLTEMPRPRGDAMWAVLDWAAQQKGTFTIKDLYRVYLQNGGRAESMGDNISSFSTGVMKYVAQPGKVKIDRKTGQSKHPEGHYDLSQKRPILQIHGGSQGGGNAKIMKWGLDKPLRDPHAARFVEPEDEGAGEAMDRLEVLLGGDKLKQAMARWQKLPNLNAVVADIKASVPKRAQMDALHVASDILMDQGKADEDDVETAADEVPPAPQDDDEEDYGEFTDAPEPFNPDDYPDEEEPAPAPQKQQAEPEPEEEPEPEPEDDVEEPTTHQAGAANFIKSQTPPPSPVMPTVRKSPVSKFFKKKK
jgi:hypothetical protein